MNQMLGSSLMIASGCINVKNDTSTELNDVGAAPATYVIVVIILIIS